MSARLKWLIVLACLGFVGILVYSSLEQSRYSVEVCVSFHSQQKCADASASTQEDAVRAAQEIDCSSLANGRDENMVCLAITPASVKTLSSK